jgi:adhesin transport system membrane fusion protein
MPIMTTKSQIDVLERLQNVKSTKMVTTSREMFFLSLALVFTIVVGSVALGFTPWQQSVSGVGEVSTLNPMHRPQTVQAPIDAQIEEWLVSEGEWVKEGQPILRLKEIKAYYLDEEQLDRMLAVRQAQEAQVLAAQNTIDALIAQKQATLSGRGFAVPSAVAKQEESLAKIRAAEQKVNATQKEYEIAKFNESRTRTLYADGLKSKRELELAENTLVKTRSEYTAATADLQGAKQSFSGASFDVGKVDVDVTSKVAEVDSKLAKAEQDFAKESAELVKLDNEIENLRVRQEQRTIVSPVHGRMVRTSVYGAGQTVKEGEELAVVVPDAGDKAVTLFITDVDAPLLSVGRQVRLQFAGFPAVQFSGWPRASKGTFAGRISVIDVVDDGRNRFRVLVEPDIVAIQHGKEEPWPEDEHLRYGTQVLGWVMLDQVPLGFELWRRFNGFQLNLQEKPPPVNNALEDAKKASLPIQKNGKIGGKDESPKFGGIKSNAGKQK